MEYVNVFVFGLCLQGIDRDINPLYMNGYKFYFFKTLSRVDLQLLGHHRDEKKVVIMSTDLTTDCLNKWCLQIIRKQVGNQNMIILTGDFTISRMHFAVDTGCDEFIAQPLSPQEFFWLAERFFQAKNKLSAQSEGLMSSAIK